uniref:Macro domain-containing protein n=1 Tax=Heterorhabditis bacteriophora TaxID=37862 RepID=A0A1I7X8F5_HETBA
MSVLYRHSYIIPFNSEQITSLNFGSDLKQSIHAVNYFECSAKQMNGVKFIFLEVLSTIEKERKKEAIRGDIPAYSIGCTMGAVGNSGPLIKQAVVNLRECITNPAAFANYKRSHIFVQVIYEMFQITYYLPFIDFGIDNKIPNDEHEQK